MIAIIIVIVLVSVAVNGLGSQEARCRAEMRRINRFIRKQDKERAKAQRP